MFQHKMAKDSRISSILLFGIPCAGKGTVGKAVSAEFPRIFYHLPSGDLVREAQKARGELAEKINDYLQNGILVPDEIMIPMYRGAVAARMASGAFNPDSQNLLVDGMCRTPAQAEELSDFLDFREVWNLTNVPNCEALKRSGIRAEEGRTDDTQNAMLKRIRDYWTVTYPTLDFFASRGTHIHCVNAYEPKSMVVEEMKRYVKVRFRVTGEWRP